MTSVMTYDYEKCRVLNNMADMAGSTKNVTLRTKKCHTLQKSEGLGVKSDELSKNMVGSRNVD